MTGSRDGCAANRTGRVVYAAAGRARRRPGMQCSARVSVAVGGDLGRQPPQRCRAGTEEDAFGRVVVNGRSPDSAAWSYLVLLTMLRAEGHRMRRGALTWGELGGWRGEAVAQLRARGVGPAQLQRSQQGRTTADDGGSRGSGAHERSCFVEPP
ncbi:uncharacterized protein CC84DRAFT_794612 [Paraphaeosphaeria sporulosa]|uniref:Uncharacterized protein n=1 Tax=Paraphaeosphaeria sporulosa TaxID=1460663 RepID=A0A177CA35_9PLEO|nr:uncharacterized protein CC84DRAFT_794612 [Paraphaeosphaeria sporulosa]OAG04513.1 hypothetical protein CC84DRAFT_794612 [Paraphaeosphaeria sporulosa]